MSRPALVWTYTAALVGLVGVAMAWFAAPLAAATIAVVVSLSTWAVMTLGPLRTPRPGSLPLRP